jgi:DNA polymerase-1
VKVLYPGRVFSETVLYDEERVRQRYGVAPEQVVDLKGLTGDLSDNIPGVPGIGDKTASRLLREFGDIEGVYRNLDRVLPPRVRQALEEHAQQARLGKELVTIDRHVPLELELEECTAEGYDRQRLVGLLQEMEFVSLLHKLPARQGETAVGVTSPPSGQYMTVRTADSLDHVMSRISEAKALALAVVSTGRHPMTARLVGIALSAAPGEACYLPLGHSGFEEQLPLNLVLDRLRPVLENAQVAKVGHNIKHAALLLARHGVALENMEFDTMVAAHLLGEKSLGLKSLAFGRLSMELEPITDVSTRGKQAPADLLDADTVSGRACADADVILRLREVLASEVAQRGGLGRLLREVEMPLVPVLVHMEHSGVALDASLLRDMSRDLETDLRSLELRIYNSVGHIFNINSSQQLSRVLYDEMGLPRPRRTKGGYSTEAAVLEGMRGMHPAIESILEYRQLAKLKSTYVDTLPDMVNPETGRLHTTFNQTTTATGRLSSSDPNLQNIPVRGDLGKKIRSAFIAPQGTLLVAGDYSQIDLRVLAHLSGDTALREAFQRDEDIHAATASRVFGVPIADVTPAMRRAAKTVNFGVVYGMSEYGLEQATDFTREEAAAFIRSYFEGYPMVKEYLESTRKRALSQGYVETLLGRRRYLPEVHSASYQVREAANRMAINMPVQGTSADIIKVAMVKLYGEMKRRRLNSKMVLQVHDDLMFEVPLDEVTEVKVLVQGVMSRAVQLSVPIRVDLKQGYNWGEME